MAELVAEHLSLGFGDVPLLNDINLTLRSGELLVCLGGNGSGKTTLLLLLSGLLSPKGGRVFVKGSNSTEVHNQVGILFQNPDHQLMAETVEQEIALGLELRGTPTDVMRVTVDAMLERFHLTEFRQHPPRALSGGQKQRVALAAIMVTKPGFLLFDEPDSYLDAPSRKDFMAGVAEVRGECGIIWTVPHPRGIPESDRFSLLLNGMLTECSQAELLELTQSPSSRL